MLDFIETLALAIIGSVTTLGLAYIAARWHATVKSGSSGAITTKTDSKPDKTISPGE
jgi:hypothetical protein